MSAKFMVMAKADVMIVTVGFASATEARASMVRLRSNQALDVTVRNERGDIVNDADLSRLASCDAMTASSVPEERCPSSA